MVWMLSKHDEATIREIEKQSDRAAAILAAACLEERLAEVLRLALEPHENVANQVFKGYGPLSTFNSKIDFGLLMGMYSLETHKSLLRVKDIRNLFAHSPSPITFKTQRIKDLCSNFTKIERRPKNLPAKDAITKEILQSYLDGNFDFRMSAWDAFTASGAYSHDSPRNRYLLAIKTMMFFITYLLKIIELRRQAIELKKKLTDFGEPDSDQEAHYWPWPSPSTYISPPLSPQPIQTSAHTRKKTSRPPRSSPA